MEESASGALRFFDRLGPHLPVLELPKPKLQEQKDLLPKDRSLKTHRPSEDHPWKKAFLPQNEDPNHIPSDWERISMALEILSQKQDISKMLEQIFKSQHAGMG
ncbi:MAG: hypothetical protein ACYCYP_06595 [Leptospirales bacterium]